MSLQIPFELSWLIVTLRGNSQLRFFFFSDCETYSSNWSNAEDDSKRSELVCVSTKTHFRCESTERGAPAPERIAAKLIASPTVFTTGGLVYTICKLAVFEFSRLQRRRQSRVSPYQTPSLIHGTKNAAIKYPSGYSRADPASLQPEEHSPASFSSRCFMNSARWRRELCPLAL